MAQLENSVSVNCSVDDAWKVVADFGGIDAWFPMADSVRVEGDDRHIGLEGMDQPVIERHLETDNETRTHRYTIVTSPLPTESYEAIWTVREDGDGAVVVWAMEFEPAEVSEVLDGIAKGALASLKEHLEGA